MTIFQKDIEEMLKRAIEFRYKGNYIQALDLFNDLEVYLLGNKEQWAELKKGEISHQLGVTFQNMKQFQAAISILRLTLIYRKRIGDQIGVAYTAFQIPMCLLASGAKKEDVMSDFGIARRNIRLAMKQLMAKQGDVEAIRQIGDMYQDLAYIAQMKAKTREAIQMYTNALYSRRESKDKRGEGLTFARLAECYLELKKPQEAKRYAQDALVVFRNIGDVNRIKQVESILAKISRQEEVSK